MTGAARLTTSERLCARAQRGRARRSFLFLFGAGVAGAALGRLPSLESSGLEYVRYDVAEIARVFGVPPLLASPPIRYSDVLRDVTMFGDQIKRFAKG